MRIFLAVRFQKNEHLTGQIEALKSELAAEKIKWVESENLHLTLKFFGETKTTLLNEIIKALKDSISGSSAFEISFNHLGIFGSRYQPRVIWMGMEDDSEMRALESKIREALEGIGIEYDRQNFVPHLTAGRIKQLSSKKYFQNVIDKYRAFDSGKIEVKEIVLLQSILHKSGPEYRLIETFPLK